MIKTVCNEYKWTPEYVSGLYLDDKDEFGLEFWYKEVVEINNKLKK